MEEPKNWTEFNPFPSPEMQEYLNAPMGPGVYELNNVLTNELVYVGEGKNVAWRMSSLLPTPLGASGRNNLPLRKYVMKNISQIHYRTLACIDKANAKKIQDEMIEYNNYLFN